MNTYRLSEYVWFFGKFLIFFHPSTPALKVLALLSPGRIFVVDPTQFHRCAQTKAPFAIRGLMLTFSHLLSLLYHLFNIRDCPEEGVYLLRDYRVSEASQAVHPGGNPISHSTHRGFREPETPERISSPERESRFPAPGGRVAFFASFAVGVGNIWFAVA